jgi:hypothetical protein
MPTYNSILGLSREAQRMTAWCRRRSCHERDATAGVMIGLAVVPDAEHIAPDRMVTLSCDRIIYAAPLGGNFSLRFRCQHSCKQSRFEAGATETETTDAQPTNSVINREEPAKQRWSIPGEHLSICQRGVPPRYHSFGTSRCGYTRVTRDARRIISALCAGEYGLTSPHRMIPRLMHLKDQRLYTKYSNNISQHPQRL